MFVPVCAGDEDDEEEESEDEEEMAAAAQRKAEADVIEDQTQTNLVNLRWGTGCLCCCRRCLHPQWPRVQHMPGHHVSACACQS